MISRVITIMNEVRHEALKDMPFPRRAGFHLLSIFLAIYITCLCMFSNNQFLGSKLGTPFFIPMFLVGIIISSLISLHTLYWFILKMEQRSTLIIPRKDNKNQSSLKVFLYATGIALVLLLIYYIAYYPGGFSHDTNDQWLQVQTGQYRSWHNPFHTFLIFLASRIWNAYSFVVLVQVIAFCCSIGHLITALHSWGFSKKWLIILEAAILLNPNTRNLNMYALKDSAFIVVAIVIASQLVDIYLSKGHLLKSSIRLLTLGTTLAFATMLRYNAILFTAPLLVLLVVIYIRRHPQVLLSALFCVCLIITIKGPLYSALNVERQEQAYGELAVYR
jgi:hypothetical protein